MPKGKCKRTEVNSKIFKLILKKRGTSINQLSKDLGWSDKTIRNGIKKGFLCGRLKTIAEKIDVSEKYLTGELFTPPYYTDEADYIDSINLYPFSDDYFLKFWSNELDNNIIETISLFGFPKEIYTNISAEAKLSFKKEYYSTIMGIADKYISPGENSLPYSVRIQFAMDDYECKLLGVDY